jgi:hypothetical protein
LVVDSVYRDIYTSKEDETQLILQLTSISIMVGGPQVWHQSKISDSERSAVGTTCLILFLTVGKLYLLVLPVQRSWIDQPVVLP